jgi:hypothetical protein
MRGLVERVRRATWRTKVALVLALGAVSAVGVGIAVASGPACDPASMRERTEALEAKYEAMPEPTSAEEQYQRSQQFEKEWMALGELCERPNGMEPEPPLGPEDAEVKHDPPGITSPAPPGLGEGLPGGCKVVNRWLGYVGGDRSRTLGHADDRDRRWADPGAQVGPARRDPGRDPGAERHPAVGDHPADALLRATEEGRPTHDRRGARSGPHARGAGWGTVRVRRVAGRVGGAVGVAWPDRPTPSAIEGGALPEPIRYPPSCPGRQATARAPGPEPSKRTIVA